MHLICALVASCLHPQMMQIFDQSIELWTGRIAMIGIVGLVAAEAIQGDAFF